MRSVLDGSHLPTPRPDSVNCELPYMHFARNFETHLGTRGWRGSSHILNAVTVDSASNAARLGPGHWRILMKKLLTLFGLLGAVSAVVYFFRRGNDDDEFLDEELQ